MSASTLGRWEHDGVLERVHRSVYAFAGAPRHPHRATLAAVLRAGAGAFAAGRSSLFVHGLLTHPPPVVELTAARQVRFPGVVVQRTQLAFGEQRIVGAVPAACIGRAIVQAARFLSEDALHQVVADAVRTGRTIPARVTAVLDRTPPRLAPGAASLRRILEGGLGHSHPERALMRLLRAAGLHGFVANMPFTGPSGRRWIIDAARADILLALEVDSVRWHFGPGRHQSDIDKFNDLQDAGWYLIRITPNELRDSPEAVLVRIRAAIERLTGVDALRRWPIC